MIHSPDGSDISYLARNPSYKEDRDRDLKVTFISFPTLTKTWSGSRYFPHSSVVVGSSAIVEFSPVVLDAGAAVLLPKYTLVAPVTYNIKKIHTRSIYEWRLDHSMLKYLETF